MADSRVMQAGFRIGVVLGAVVSLATGLSVALLPTTPTWTLWKLTLAIDNRDTGEILDLVDIPRVASRTLDELAQGNTRTADGLDLAGMALESEALRPGLAAAPEHLTEKHWLRKHGTNAYYGQK